jgi:signal transduction histidine kinase
MMRWLLKRPRTVTGQIILLIGMSLLLANGLSICTMYFMLASNTNRATPAGFVRAATVAQLAHAADSPKQKEDILSLAEKVGVPFTRLAARATPEGREGPGQLSFFQRKALDRFLALTGFNAKPDWVVVGPDHTIAMRLADGSALAFPFPDGLGFGIPGMIIAPIVYIVSGITIVLIGMSLYAARFVTAPLSSFAEAAYGVGRTADSQVTISETGPVEIIQVARALNEMRARVTALLDERMGMLTAISHDLRTPLTRIRLRAERIAQASPIGKVAEGMLADIARMEQMLTETLVYMRDNARSEPCLPVDLPSVLETICVELADLGKPVGYRGPSRLVYRCQPAGLTRAVGNLVDNGLKYGNFVVVELVSLDEGAVQIDVSDDGPGIPYSLRRKVFEPFFKVDAARASSSKEGFGLGLSIARNVVKAHGGDIELLAIAPQGTCVRITLPPPPDQGDEMRPRPEEKANGPAGVWSIS